MVLARVPDKAAHGSEWEKPLTSRRMSVSVTLCIQLAGRAMYTPDNNASSDDGRKRLLELIRQLSMKSANPETIDTMSSLMAFPKDSRDWEALADMGVEELDHEHREILWVIMAMRNLLQSGVNETAKRDALTLLVDDALEFVRRHFAQEESLMNLSGYPRYLDHKKEHEGFLCRLLELRGIVQTASRTMAPETVMLMSDWLHRHVLESDRPLVPYLMKSLSDSRAGTATGGRLPGSAPGAPDASFPPHTE